jgi:uncharacterized protein YqcC (DUF446 family)
MTLDHRVRERLLAIEALLRETEHWQDSAPIAARLPANSRFASTPWSRLNGCSGY